MKNFPIQYEGKEYWISRAVAVVGYIFCNIDGELYILANKRGKGCPDFQGYWNVPCGYLDFDETTREACCREIAEETNLTVNPKDLILYNILDDPTKDSKQNVTFRYWAYSNIFYKGQTIYAKGAEPDEVEEVEWIPIRKLDKYEFAFNQRKTIIELIRIYLRNLVSKSTLSKLEQLDV